MSSSGRHAKCHVLFLLLLEYCSCKYIVEKHIDGCTSRLCMMHTHFLPLGVSSRMPPLNHQLDPTVAIEVICSRMPRAATRARLMPPQGLIDLKRRRMAKISVPCRNLGSIRGGIDPLWDLEFAPKARQVESFDLVDFFRSEKWLNMRHRAHDLRKETTKHQPKRSKANTRA